MQPMHDLCYGTWTLFSSGQGWVAFPSCSTRHLQTPSRLRSNMLVLLSCSPDLGPKLGLFCLATPRMHPPRCLSGTSDSQGPSGASPLPTSAPSSWSSSWGVKSPEEQASSPVSPAIPVMLRLLGLSSALTLSSSFRCHFGHPGQVAHLLPESLHLLLGAHPAPPSAAPGFGLSS